LEYILLEWPGSGSRSTINMPKIDDDIRVELEKLRDEYIDHEFGSFFKYCSDSEKVIEGVFRNHKIRFTQPRALNDPLEFNPTILFTNTSPNYQVYELDGIKLPSIELFMRVQIIESQINNYGILSLAKIPDSFDM
jgi:hypothetical protein